MGVVAEAAPVDEKTMQGAFTMRPCVREMLNDLRRNEPGTMPRAGEMINRLIERAYWDMVAGIETPARPCA